jgi:protein SCO1/2
MVRNQAGARRWTLRIVLGLVATLASRLSASAQQAQTGVAELEGVGITEHLGARLPLDAGLVDENGKAVRLGDFFEGDKPVVLSLVYFGCPMLCSLVLNGLVDGLKEIPLAPGADFEIITISFDPRETPTLARLKKQNYVQELGRPGAASGWHFLTGREENIRKVTEAVGFHYRYVEATQQFAHAAAIYLLTPDGRLARYLYGVVFDPATLRLGLVEASEGKMGSSLDRVLLYCFHYDPKAGRYTLAAVTIMRVGGVLMVVVLATVLGVLWRAEARRRRARADASSGAAADES